MDNKEVSNVSKYILLGILALFIFLAYKIIAPYIIVLISSFILAYLVRPVYVLLNKKLNNSFSAVICIILVLAIFIVPLFLVLSQVGFQAYNFANSGGIEKITDKISELPVPSSWDINVEEASTTFLNFIWSNAKGFLTEIPTIILSFLVLLFGLYYTLISWESLSKKVEKLLPFKNKQKVAEEINKSTKGIIYGYLLIAILDFLVASVGFYFLGIKIYLLLAFMIAIFAFVPGVGPGFVWVPTAIYYFVAGNYFVAGGVVVLGLIMGLLIETLLMTKILGKTANIHPLIMLLGILGGTALFGLFGFIIGPLILVYTIRIIEGLSEHLNGV